MDLENNFRKIRESVNINDKKVLEHKKHPDDTWSQYDSQLPEFGGTFFKTLPSEYTKNINLKTDVEIFGEPFKKYIEDTIEKNNNRKHYAVEFGGPGSNLFEGFKKDLFTKTVGVCLGDTRFDSKVFSDKQKNHFVVEGDILKPNDKVLFDEIVEKLGTQKVDLIISRMMGPLSSTNKNPAILNAVVKKWYNMLNENGILFAQFEYFKEHNPNMDQKKEHEGNPEELRNSEIHVTYWADQIRKKSEGLIDIQLGRGVLRLHKREGAPDELPNIEDMFSMFK